MIKLFILILFTFSFLKADYKIVENKNMFLVKITNSYFEQDLVNLKDEINFEGFTIVYELNLAKGTNELAELLEKKGSLKNGINLGICKSSFTLQMVQENFNNINYCPLAISIYSQDESATFISYKFYKPFKENDKIAEKINEKLKELILNSLD